MNALVLKQRPMDVPSRGKARDLYKSPVAALCERRRVLFYSEITAVTDRRYNSRCLLQRSLLGLSCQGNFKDLVAIRLYVRPVFVLNNKDANIGEFDGVARMQVSHRSDFVAIIGHP